MNAALDMDAAEALRTSLSPIRLLSRLSAHKHHLIRGYAHDAHDAVKSKYTALYLHSPLGLVVRRAASTRNKPRALKRSLCRSTSAH